MAVFSCCLKKTALASAIVLISALAQAEPGSEGPFLGLSGHWSGAGTVTMANGAHRGVCRVDRFAQKARYLSDTRRFPRHDVAWRERRRRNVAVGPRPVRETDEWLWESATEFCAALDRYGGRAMELRDRIEAFIRASRPARAMLLQSHTGYLFILQARPCRSFDGMPRPILSSALRSALLPREREATGRWIRHKPVAFWSNSSQACQENSGGFPHFHCPVNNRSCDNGSA